MGSTHIPGRPLWSPAPNTASRAECYTELAVDGGVHWRAVGPQSRRHQGFQRSNSGRGSAWLERLVRDQEVGGSNPLAPTTFLQTNQTVTATSCSITALGLGSLGSIEANEAGTSKPTP